MATAHLPASAGQPPTGRRWVLVVEELADMRVRVSGLPEDRHERLSVVYRLRDVVAATCHTDARGLGDGLLWRRFCGDVYTTPPVVTVEWVPGEG